MNSDAPVPASTGRPYPPPESPWVQEQVWNDLLFAHWPIPPEVLRPLVPAVLPLDTFDGRAWLGIVPFWMSGVRPRGARGPLRLPDFPELNVRTYVTVDGKPGVYFFSLDAGNRLAVHAARSFYHLPYVHARMTTGWHDGWVTYASHRIERGVPQAELIGRYRPDGDVFFAEASSLEYFLTARYCLYAVDRINRIYRAEIDHAPWPLQVAEAELELNTMTRPLGLALPDVPPLLHFARRMEMVGWWPEKLDADRRLSPEDA
jgi:uncharacterized protein YqjF (DUF2071 family)